MLLILRALLSRWACPWCSHRSSPLETLTDWVVNQLPDRVIIALGPYDRWVGQTGIPIHQRHAPWDREDTQEAS